MFELLVCEKVMEVSQLCNEVLEYAVTLADVASKYLSKQCRLSKRSSFGGVLGKFVNMFRLGVFEDLCSEKRDESRQGRGGVGLTLLILGTLY